jgi:hypothetical protein
MDNEHDYDERDYQGDIGEYDADDDCSDGDAEIPALITPES